MAEKRIKFSSIVKNQLPTYVENDFPLISEFLKQYYNAQEFQSGPIDIIQNIDQYIKVDEQTSINHDLILGADIDEFAETVTIDLSESPRGTDRFPDSYGLIRIGNEIITYTGKTDSTLTGCIRGFSGVTSYKSESNPENLVFSTTEAAEHKKGSAIENLSCLFLKEFLQKIKIQFLPGLSNRSLTSSLDQATFIKQSKDFYSSKGTSESFKILFKVLYGEDISIIRPKEYLITPSNANNLVTSNFVVEGEFGNPENLENRTIFQDFPTKAYVPIYSVEKIDTGIGKTYYKLSYDGGYNRDQRVKGSTYGAFNVSPKTKAIGNIAAGSTFIDVDSTVGFPTSGELFVRYPSGVTADVGIVSYTSKNLTQFIDCSNIDETIIDGGSIGISSFVHTDFSLEDDIEIRLGSILSDFEKPEDIFDFKVGDNFQVKSLGIENDTSKFKNWLYNVPSQYVVDKIELIDNVSPKTYKLTLKNENYLRLGDVVNIISQNNSEFSNQAVINDIITPKVLTIKTNATLPISGDYYIRRLLTKITSQEFSSVENSQSNVINTYKKKYSNDLLVASNSLPSYETLPLQVDKNSVTFSGTFKGETFNIDNHGFYTGESINYIPQKSTEDVEVGDGQVLEETSIASSLFGGVNGGEGLYFIKRVDSNNIKLAKSAANLYSSKFLNITSSTTVTDNVLEPFAFGNKTLRPQKIYREVSSPIDNNFTTETQPGVTGVLVNGVETLNYKSKDVIHYGKLEKVEVLSPGVDFDVINPPLLQITDPVGTGATGFLAVNGNLREIQIVDRGFDYIDIPTVSITGGNGVGAKALATTKLISHSIDFFSDHFSKKVGLGTTVSTIGFSTYHKFRSGEELIYKTNSQQGVGGLSTNAKYFASIVDSSTVKLHNTIGDAVVGINTVTLTVFGVGKHTLESVNKKSILDSINIVNRGVGYENKKRSVSVSGINTSSGVFTISNHDYKSGEIIRYSVGTGDTIGGLTSGIDYYATVLDSNNFKLSELGSTTQGKNFFYETKQYVNITSTGSGTHFFNYQPITIQIGGAVGVSSVGTETFKARVQPIFRGEVSSIHLSDKGSGYGTDEVINFIKNPNVSIVSGSNAQAKPIVSSDGKIVDVIIENVGSNYTSIPNINLTSSSGIGCVLTPIFSNGRLTEIKIIETGSGYDLDDTEIDIEVSETDLVLQPKIQNWRINLFEKLYKNDQIKSDDVVISESSSKKFELQCYHLYAPRKLREIIYSISEDGSILFGKPDLKIVDSVETAFQDHSPIIGWAYDGNPIYGPYGYSKNNGGIATLMKSSYRLNSNRFGGPPTSIYPLGFFIEDYTYYENNDDSYLDKNNGRFCITPDYPNGTYAYFTTINDTGVESSGVFKNFKIPKFPYLIGQNFYSTPNEFNFSSLSNQDDYKIEENDWYRNTLPYNIKETEVDYPYIFLPNNLNQTGKIIATNRGKVDRVEIKSAGDLYKVGDSLNFSSDRTTGFGAAGKVSFLKGKPVESLTASINILNSAEIFPSDKKGFYTIENSSPHSLQTFDIISITGVSTTSSKIEGGYTVGVNSERFRLVGLGTTSVALGTTSVTGIITFFNVAGKLSNSNIVPNDVLAIGSEKVKVLNVDKENSRFRVIRAVNNTTGSSHTIGSLITEDPRRFTINSGFKTTYQFRRNQEIYFVPTETVGLGTTSVGIGSALSFANFGLNSVGFATTGASSLEIPIRALYLRNHRLKTGDIVTYSPGGGSGINYNESGKIGIAATLTEGQELFVARITNDLIGVATERVGLGTTGEFVGLGTQSSTKTIFFTGIGTGDNHSLSTNYNNITGKVTRRVVSVVTSGQHGIKSAHDVIIDVNPSIASTYVVKYSDQNKRALVGIQTFGSAGVNTTTNAINIDNHGYSSGDKVIHLSSNPCGGLENDKIYYIIKVDDNNFKLSTTLYNANNLKPLPVGITSVSLGEFGLVNPRILAYKSSTLDFDISDSSLTYTTQGVSNPAFKLNFYTDADFTKIWESDKSSRTFSVARTFVVGITSAKVSVSIGNTTPEKLYYKLDPILDGTIPATKSGIIIDDELIGNNEIKIKNSVYNGRRRVSISGTNFFTFSLAEIPERDSYVSTASSITYTTDCTHTSGPIAAVEVTSSGRNYDVLPEVTSVNSVSGVNADLFAVSNDIGLIKKVHLNDIGYDFPTDKTLTPSASLPQILKVNSFAKIDTIGITSSGRGYNSAPLLVAFDGKTGKLITDLDLNYKLGDSEVTISRNTRGINNSIPTLIPIRNSNGVGISTVGFNTITKDVMVELSTGFSDNFPFSVNDKVLIEGVSIGIGSTAKGFNSSNYNYKLFTINEVTPNLGGAGATVSYNLANDLINSEVPGTFDPINSAGVIVPEKFFPIFDTTLLVGDYLVDEKVLSNGKEGIVQSWDRTTKTLRILSTDTFKENESIKGLTSDLMGIASSVTEYESYFETGVTSQIFSGTQNESGTLNVNQQRLQDSFYYQNFSYSLRSRVPFDDWKEVVSSVNHTLGYKKFGDLQIETTNNVQSLTVGVTTDLTDLSVVSAPEQFVDLNCVYDFDLATENNITLLNTPELSNEINFNNKILSDFTESVGNRVLSIDDISSQFNSNPRSTAFSIVATFPLNDFRFRKYFTYFKDTRFTQERQAMIVDLIHDGTFGYISQYGRIESTYDQGSFDFSISGTTGQLLFFPTKTEVNDFDISAISYNLNDNLLSTGTTSIGESIIDTESVKVNPGVSTTIVGVGSTYHSLKVLLSIAPDVENISYGSTSTFNVNEFQSSELSIIHDGSEVYVSEYGTLFTSPDGLVGSGFGTYRAHLDGSQIKLDFHPGVGIGTTGVINTVIVGMTTATVGVSTLDMKHARLESRITQISSSGSPTENVIGLYPTHVSEGVDNYDAAYCIIQIHDTTNDRYEFLEYFVLDDHIEGETTSETFDVEFGNVQSHIGLGTVGSKVVTNSVGTAATTQILFTPLAGIAVDVHVYMNALRIEDDTKDNIDLNNGSIQTIFGQYTGTQKDIKRSFQLTHKNENIFTRSFDADSASIVNIDANTITIPNHFYVSGEELKYVSAGIGSTQALGIAITTFTKTGFTTNLLPESGIFAIKVDDEKIKLARSASDALKSTPISLDITSVGIGTSHRFIATNKNPKVLITIDNLIQSPIVSTALTTTLANLVVTTDNILSVTGVTSFFGGDLIKINNEIMKIEGIGIGSTNAIRVRRGWMGTQIAAASTGDLITKVFGDYNIVENTLNFIEAPFGNTPIGTSTNDPDDRDFIGITTSSSFQGRTFLRGGVPNTGNDAYHKNHVYDDISESFNGTNKLFPLRTNATNVTGIKDEGAIILINDVYQTIGGQDNYELVEQSGITSIRFVGTARNITNDVGISSFPKGGIIVSVGSTAGFGYQPLVAAGGTAIVSAAGTISSVSIGNSGSGYRSGIQTTVNVSVGTSSLFSGNLVSIGTASMLNGHITGVAITNPGTGYTTSNPPFVVIDGPLSYSGIALTYTSSSSGFGTGAIIDVVVGQGSSIIDFEIKNTGLGYGNGQILTIPTGGAIGIPTFRDSGLGTDFVTTNQFEITIENVQTDDFGGWSLGVLQTLDNVDNYIDGVRVDFPLLSSGQVLSIIKSKGSKIELDQLLLVFVNNILQVPGEGYNFNGGAVIKFTEPPKIGDTIKIVFYKGSGSDLDVLDREVIETVKTGDTLTLNYDAEKGQKSYQQEDIRTVSQITSIGASKTLPYYGPGTTKDVNLERPLTWCRQTEDKIINGKAVGKDRELYEPVINPVANIISPVSVGATIIYVDRIRPLFTLQNENADANLRTSLQKFVTITPNVTVVGASATAVVSAAGTISSIVISDGGVGYTTAPGVGIANTFGVGVGATTTAQGTATVSVAGTISNVAITSIGFGYTSTNPPAVLIGPPIRQTETNTIQSYAGDSGIIVGLGTTSVGVGSTGMVLHLHIPYDSEMRNTNLVGTAVTISGISTGDYFIVRNSNLGTASTSINSLGTDNTTIIGTGVAFIDNVYVVNSVGITTQTISGVTTSISKVTVNTNLYPNGISGIITSPFFGDYSWGKVTLLGREKIASYPANTRSGIGTNELTGISTSTKLRRTKQIRFKNFT